MSDIIQAVPAESVNAAIYINYRDSIEKNIDRRYSVTKFNFSVIGAVGVGYGFLKSDKISVAAPVSSTLASTMLILSAIFCVVWVFQILRFREVSRIKHEVAIEMEKNLGISAVISEEEKFMKNSSIVEYTYIEIFFPVMAGILCVLGFVILM